MFGWKNKRLALQIEELDRRLEHNSKMIEEDHHDLAELKTLVVELKAHIERLHLEVGTLRSRQQALRLALSEAMTEPASVPKQTTQDTGLASLTPPLAYPGTIIVDHVCVDSDFNVTGNSDICIYCHPDLRNND
ncbi:MAG: hypothetical protein ACXABY_02130 [Candidatus Thorarchaeota archaeon]|jgi:septal ring factor EnvC (AmiA/AmiB activator)